MICNVIIRNSGLFLKKWKTSPDMYGLVMAFIFVSGIETSNGGKDSRRLSELYNIFIRLNIVKQ